MTDTINILFIGDVFAKGGRRLVRELLPSLINRHEADLVIANAENASGGLGLSPKAAEELFAAGCDVLTSGNHIFKHRDIYGYLDENPRLLRPLSYPEPCPGQGVGLYETAGGVKVGVINLLGRVFMEPFPDPFRLAELAAGELKDQGASVILLDFHAEATSEKRALGFHLAGRISAVLGTHTHVQTADQEILANYTAYITDAGMTGPHDSVIGMKKELVIGRFLNGRPTRFEAAKRGLRLEGVALTCEAETGRATHIERIQEVMENSEEEKA